jgi:hypothetical protein
MGDVSCPSGISTTFSPAPAADSSPFPPAATAVARRDAWHCTRVRVAPSLQDQEAWKVAGEGRRSWFVCAQGCRVCVCVIFQLGVVSRGWDRRFDVDASAACVMRSANQKERVSARGLVFARHRFAWSYRKRYLVAGFKMSFSPMCCSLGVSWCIINMPSHHHHVSSFHFIVSLSIRHR